MQKVKYLKLIITPEQVKQLGKGGSGVYISTPGYRAYVTCKDKIPSKLIKLMSERMRIEEQIKKLKDKTRVRRIHSKHNCPECGKVVKGLKLHMRFKHQGVESPINIVNRLRSENGTLVNSQTA